MAGGCAAAGRLDEAESSLMWEQTCERSPPTHTHTHTHTHTLHALATHSTQNIHASLVSSADWLLYCATRAGRLPRGINRSHGGESQCAADDPLPQSRAPATCNRRRYPPLVACGRRSAAHLLVLASHYPLLSPCLVLSSPHPPHLASPSLTSPHLALSPPDDRRQALPRDEHHPQPRQRQAALRLRRPSLTPRHQLLYRAAVARPDGRLASPQPR